MKKLYNLTMKIVGYISMAMLVTMNLIVAYMVFTRSFLNFTPSWGEELSRLLMVWFSFLAIPIGVHANIHVKIDFIYELVGPKTRNFIEKFIDVSTLTFGIFLMIWGYNFTLHTFGSNLPSLQIPSAYLNLCVPISGLLIIVTSIERLITRDAKTEVV